MSPFAESEYSPEAETVYADFVAAGGGDDAAFAELCERHPDLADELEGLHADFAGVAGVLRRVRERERSVREPVAAPAEPTSAALDVPPPVPPSAAAVSDSTPAAASGGHGAKLALVLLGLAVAAGIWIGVERRAALRERDALAVQLEEQRSLAERELRAREDAEQQAHRSRAQADEAEDRARHAAYATRLGRAHALLSADSAEHAQAVLAEVPPQSRGWEWSHLARRVERIRRADAQRRLAAAVFAPLADEHLARAAAAWRELDDAPPIAADELPPPDLEWSDAAEAPAADEPRRFELTGDLVRIYVPGQAEPLLELPVPAPTTGLAFQGGALWLRLADGRSVAWDA